MTAFNWTNIISLNSSQNDAFEELVCQLAKQEQIDNKKEFIKVGNPDGGVECYIILDNDNEIGFQAKWFLTTPQENQWNQIEKSFKTALEKHPKMTTYYVSIPLDRSDPRIDKQTWFMDKWNEKVTRWKKFAQDNYSRDIEIEYWGSSELITRLSKDSNSGLRSFFFGDIDLSDKWLKEQNRLAINDLGARYTPEVNVELDILENFDALSRNDTIKQKFEEAYHNLMVKYRNLLSNVKKEDLPDINKEVDEFNTYFLNLNFLENKFIDFDRLDSLLKNIMIKLMDKTRIIGVSGSEGEKYLYKYTEEFQDSIYEYFELLENKKLLNLFNNPFMVLKGDAGIGKSHLLADIVQNERVDSSSIFLLGQHFREDKNPWTQIFDLLQLKCNKDEFLGALNAKAETQKKRLIIFIDAINEGKGRDFWNEFLISFIESIKKYEWLGLVLSIRSSYYELIIPKDVFEKGLAIPITHYGFEGVEYNASKIFFENYNISQPSIPLLHPEFSNPLFLKLFCEGLNKKGLTYIPDGYEGITSIIKFFMEGIEEKLYRKYRHIKSLKLIDKTLKLLIPKMLDSQMISYEEAFLIIVQELSDRYKISSEFLDDLITEGLLIKNIVYDFTSGEHIERLYFSYERFEDHLKVKYLLENYVDINNPKQSFEGEELNKYFKENMFYKYRGIIDAMSIQMPEYCNTELLDTVEQNEDIIDSFFDSLIWRKVETITPVVIYRIQKNIDNKHFQEKIFKVLFSCASNPKHPLNAELLFDYLSKFSMRDRDVFFITLLNSIYINYDVNPIKHLIDWSWSDEKKDYISDESLFLTSITLSWLLTTSNRKLRDYATKALVSLLQNRVSIVLELLKKFENIDEMHIYERLFAVSFGIVVRVENDNGLKELGKYGM